MSDTISWPSLTLVQRRLLGVLVEKSKTTPDGYPLTINSLSTGANQKSNRDPITNLTDDDVEEGLTSLLPLGLVTRITGSRVERWRHNLYDVWSVDKIELAILAELFLRGSQTEGELRQHVNRMDPVPDLDTLRAKLKPLQTRGLVHWLGEEGRRGSTIMHGFCAPAELDALRQRAKTIESAAPHPSSPPPAAPNIERELTSLRDDVGQLRELVERLSNELRQLKDTLGA